LTAIARPLYASDSIDVDLDQSLYALDFTTIDLCLSLFPWAKFRKHKAAVKMHTLLDLHGNIPTFIHITEGRMHDVNILDAGGQDQRRAIRSHRHSDRHRFRESLSRFLAPSQLSRYRNEETTQVPQVHQR